MRVGILGAGESGTGAALLADKMQYDVFVSDSGVIAESYRTELEQHTIPFEERGHSFERLVQADMIVRSPGIPQTAEIIGQLRAREQTIISEIEFAFRHCEGKVIAVTGSNGKTTTSMLIYHLLDANQIDAVLCGNVGESFARKVAERGHDWYVVEVSSFQLEDVDRFQPEIAVLLNITADHLDRYGGSIRQYAHAKWRIARKMQAGQLFIYNRDDVAALGLLKEAAPEAELRPVAAGDVTQSAHIPQVLSGPHDRFNLTCAMKAAERVGLTHEQMMQAVQTFAKPEHRMEEVALIGGVRYINDSKATNTDSVYYALLSVDGPVIWIAGGQDKGNEYTTLMPEVRKRVKVLICLGIDNRNLIEAFSSEVDEIMETTSMFEAVRVAASNAVPGDTVLLSPACASFDLFVNYKDRGKQFKQAVTRIRE